MAGASRRRGPCGKPFTVAELAEQAEKSASPFAPSTNPAQAPIHELADEFEYHKSHSAFSKRLGKFLHKHKDRNAIVNGQRIRLKLEKRETNSKKARKWEFQSVAQPSDADG